MKYLRNVALALVAFVFVACGSSFSDKAEVLVDGVYDKDITSDELAKELGLSSSKKIEGVRYRIEIGAGANMKRQFMMPNILRN